MKTGGIEFEGYMTGCEVVNTDVNRLPQDVATAIASINDGLVGATYRPIWYVAKKRMINCTSHLFIAEEIRTTRVQSKMIVAIIIDIPADDITGKEARMTEIIEEQPMPTEVQYAFDTVARQFVGSRMKAIMYLGKKLVHGTNYYILGSIKPITTNAQERPVIIGVNVCEGNFTIVSIEGINAMDSLGYAFSW